MKTGISASDRIFTILNVSDITNLLDGAIYKEEPLSELIYQKRNITITNLPTVNDFINEHVVNVNIYVPDLKTGQSDESTLNTIAQAVISKLESYNATGDYYDLQVTANQNLKDEHNRSFVNIRVEINTE
jgi:3,4-dihydroxy-2-butanone 4-phosphate synthase